MLSGWVIFREVGTRIEKCKLKKISFKRERNVNNSLFQHFITNLWIEVQLHKHNLKFRNAVQQWVINVQVIKIISIVLQWSELKENYRTQFYIHPEVAGYEIAWWHKDELNIFCIDIMIWTHNNLSEALQAVDN